jgi:hypothetical protein
MTVEDRDEVLSRRQSMHRHGHYVIGDRDHDILVQIIADPRAMGQTNR